MTPSQVRTELLAEHAALRALIVETRRLIEEGATGGATRGALTAAVEQLAAALRAHNAHEEAVLREMIKDVDAWGPARAEIMDESHADQHEDLVGALLVTNSSPDAQVAGRSVVPVLDRLLAHMAREEEVLLSEEVLRDDDVVIEYFGG